MSRKKNNFNIILSLFCLLLSVSVLFFVFVYMKVSYQTSQQKINSDVLSLQGKISIAQNNYQSFIEDYIKYEKMYNDTLIIISEQNKSTTNLEKNIFLAKNNLNEIKKENSILSKEIANIEVQLK